METQATGWKETLAYLVAWLVSVVLLLVDLLAVRYVILAILGWMRVDRWTGDFWNRAFLLILACAGIALTISFEYYFRRGSERGLLGRRVLRVIGIQVVVAVLAFGGQAAILALS
jgi:hypothetical protein